MFLVSASVEWDLFSGDPKGSDRVPPSSEVGPRPAELVGVSSECIVHHPFSGDPKGSAQTAPSLHHAAGAETLTSVSPASAET